MSSTMLAKGKLKDSPIQLNEAIKPYLTLFRSLLFGLLLCSIPLTLSAEENISVQLKWKHAFQFAGLYMAKEQGFYDRRGLNVTLIEGGPGKSSIDYVTDGPARYGVADTGVSLAHASGKPVKALAAIFQNSPLALVVKEDSGIKKFSDLHGKRVMLQSGNLNADIIAAMSKSGVSEKDFIRQEISYNIYDLIDGKTDAYAVYVTDQPHQLEQLGIPYLILHPKKLGIEFYGDILITSDEEVKNHPQRAQAFTEASLLGWIYALDHIDETIELILTKYNSQGFSSRQLYFEASKTAEMILKDMVGLGYMSGYRWKQIAKTYAELGLMPTDYTPDSFIYHPEAGYTDLLNQYKWQLIIFGLLFLLLIFVLQFVMLRRQVRIRTQSLKSSEVLQTSISNVLEMVAHGAPIETILEQIVYIYEGRSPNMRASVLLTKHGKLYNGAAPNLPDEYNDAVEGLEIGPMVASCGSAAFLKERVIVTDIANDPRWAPYTSLALPHKLLACWSEPILTIDGDILGTFGMYYDHPRAPSPEEISDISNAAKLAGFAIERDRSIASLQKLSRAIDQAGEVITITNRDGIIEYTNPAFTQITGYSAKEVIGKPAAILKNPLLADKIRNQLLNGQGWQGRVTEQRKDGSTYPAALNISPVRNEHGEITHFVGVHENLTEIQAMEEKFQQAQKMETIGTLVGGIAHDFNNMLAGITGNLYLAKKDVSKMPETFSRLERIESLTGRATEMIKQMLAFAKKDIIEKKNVSLSLLIHESINLHQLSVSENIELNLNIASNLHVMADATQLQQILLNLVTNARDAVKKVKHPSISIQLETFTADAAFMEQHETTINHFVHLSVSDNGHGIDPDVVKNIYEPFFTTKEVGKGTGLGLSMVFGSIQSHDGIISVESIVNRGATFHIYLPLVKAEAEATTPAMDSDLPLGHGETILVVDDDSFVVEITTETLKELGYNFLKASNGIEAVELYRSKQDSIDLVIMDMVMPKMSGKDAAKEIQTFDPAARIVFATGYDPDGSFEFDLSESDNLTLLKPFTVQELSKIVQKVLSD
ncbi:MAG: ABC transporter substrate-binding protein [Mariprofundaceae bacterium]